MKNLAIELRDQGRKPYIIGNCPLGAIGYANAAMELYHQSKDEGLGIKHVVIVGAMAATAAGFVYGTAMLGHPFHVHVVSVEYTKDHLHTLLQDLCNGMTELLGSAPACTIDDVMTVYDDYLGPGYAIPTPEAIKATYDLAKSEGLFLENVYNSKTLYGMSELIRVGVIANNEPVCFVNTGGAPALFAQAKWFQPSQ